MDTTKIRFIQQNRYNFYRKEICNWGSCTYKNDLALNYKLIMAPPDVLDYVVVHEMCHMEHKNHSKNFWNRVSSIMIDYKEKRNWLKEHGGKLKELL